MRTWEGPPTDIALLVFDGVSALDAIGPYEVLVRLPGARLGTVGVRNGPVRTETGALGPVVDRELADAPRPDVLVVPGGPGTVEAAADPHLTAWLRDAHASSTRTLTVCSGSVLLAATGALHGQAVTTSWHVRDQLARWGARFVPERAVPTDRTWTTAGSTAGIDATLRVAADLAGEDVARALQLGLEYRPDPPFDSGDRPPVRRRSRSCPPGSVSPRRPSGGPGCSEPHRRHRIRVSLPGSRLHRPGAPRRTAGPAAEHGHRQSLRLDQLHVVDRSPVDSRTSWGAIQAC